MKTVKELRIELNKFPDDAECHAYEGEAIGVVVSSADGESSGFIYMTDSVMIPDKETSVFREKR